MFELPLLGYDFAALEPYIDTKTMEIHHGKHHGAYVEKLNTALKDLSDWQSKSIEDILKDLDKIDESVRTAVRNNGGGHHNHSLFWETMKPGGSKQPAGDLSDGINRTFGSFDDFKAKFAEAAVNRFGSGWAWLVRWPAESGDKLEIYSTANQDSPLMEGKVPILGLDVWEHAYYLKYQNRRPEYIEAWWNIVNWDVINSRLA